MDTYSETDRNIAYKCGHHMDRQEICLHSLRLKSRRGELAGREHLLAVSSKLFLVSANTDIKTLRYQQCYRQHALSGTVERSAPLHYCRQIEVAEE